jgi:MFS family permease
MAGRLGALEERRFRLLFVGQTLSSLGDNFVPVASAFAVLGTLDGSAADFGAVLTASALARVLFVLVGGVWADRLPRRAVMLTTDVVRFASQGFVAADLLTGNAEIWHLVVASAVAGAAAAFFGPAANGVVPETISPERLQQANALIGITRSATAIVGLALGGVVVVAAGPGWAFAVDAASFALSGLFLVRLRLPHASRPARQRFARDLVEGWHEVRARTWVWAPLLCFSVSNVAVATFFVLGPVVVERDLGGAGDWTIALVGGGVGGVLGGILALRLRPRHPLRWAFPPILFCALQLLALVPPVPAAGLFVAGALSAGGITVSNALWNTVLQERIPRHALSRVFAYDLLVSYVWMPVGFTLAGPLADAVGTDTTLAAVAGLCAVANLAVLLVPAVRDLPPAGPEPGQERPASREPVTA